MQYGVKHCVLAIGYVREDAGADEKEGDRGDCSGSQMQVMFHGLQITSADFDAYDRITGEIVLQVPTDGERKVTPSLNDVRTDHTITKNVSSHPAPIRGKLFGGGIAFPQDLIDGGGNREPWVGFKRSIEQVDLMVEVFVRLSKCV